MSIPRSAMDARKEGNVYEKTQTVTTIFAELRDDLKEFVQTRFQLVVAELRVKVIAWKTGALTLAIAVIFACAAFLLLTGALVSVIAASLGAFLALLIVGALYLIIAAGAARLGYKKLTSQSVPPERTLRVLKEDQVWLQNEAKSA